MPCLPHQGTVSIAMACAACERRNHSVYSVLMMPITPAMMPTIVCTSESVSPTPADAQERTRRTFG